jgi:hypothetical protein
LSIVHDEGFAPVVKSAGEVGKAVTLLTQLPAFR